MDMATTKLVVEVLDASDLMPKDGQGSASPYVQIDFNGQEQRTQTKQKDLNPQWSETLFFNINDHKDLNDQTIVVTIYNDTKSGHHKNFLGRVRISGVSVPTSQSEASVQRYPLDKRGMFSHIKGDIALRVYLAMVSLPPQPPPVQTQNWSVPQTVDTQFEHNHNHHHQQQQQPPPSIPLREINTNMDPIASGGGGEQKKKNKEKEVRTFYSIGVNGPPPPVPNPIPAPLPQMRPATVEMRTDFMKPGPIPMMHMQFPGQKPDFGVVETRPMVPATAMKMGYYRAGDKTASTYDLVEPMQYLYVRVVKAKELPAMDAVSGSLDPYVEVKLGNYKGLTNHFEKNQNPVWNKVFAFSKDNLQANVVEVTVKDKDIGKDDLVGKVWFDLNEVPVRVPPDSPLAPQWYRLVDKKGLKNGEIMLAVWMGTQADEAFPEAWHSDAHDVGHQALHYTRSKVYFSPKLYYLRVLVIEAQDLVPSDRSRPLETFVRVLVGNQTRMTRPSPLRHVNPVWKEDLMFVASEPFEEMLMLSVENRVGQGKDESLGCFYINVKDIPRRLDTTKMLEPRWFNLLDNLESDKKREHKFSSKIHLGLCLEQGYHVLDESTPFSSDLQPSSKILKKPPIGILELGILSARNLLPMKGGGGGGTTDAYCVAKYGNKWVRTRTLLNTLNPRWNEQYTWEVYDPCTVITIGVFDNRHVKGNHEEIRDEKIGKVRIRLSTLETDRIYTHYYPLLVLQPSGLKKHGELQLAVRFTCTAWVNMVTQYGKPLLPKMHYIQPIPIRHIDMLRHQAMQIVAARLIRAEPPLRKEVVEYMLDANYHMWSLRRSKANFQRIMSLLSGVTAVIRWLNDVCNWRNPITTCLVQVLFLILVSCPGLILPTIFLYLFVIGLWNYRFRPRHPLHMDARMSQAEFVHPDELDEEFDNFPSNRQPEIVRMRYDRLRSVGGRVQTVLGDLATQGERVLALLSWRDPRGTAIFIMISLIWAVVLYVTPVQVVAIIIGLYLLRHPRFRNRMPSVPVNFFKRLPAKTDMLL
ncbi:FT-interacting protein 7 [Impatiens glandulifera]|uniref:FT-interacting protein 7 n=1 Tax=Impatiens glandulifera TaxID=253017 RepID=UPI001FB0931A|nr:FT-interacting protein 7 [Impatiens glandulifera]